MPHPLRLLLIWLGVLSTLSFLLYGWDKAQAKLHRRRIPEAALLFCALLGGSAGALLAKYGLDGDGVYRTVKAFLA